MRVPIIFFFCFLALVLTGLNPLQARAGTVQDVQITTDQAHGTVDFTVIIDQHVAYRAFLLNNPKRVVIDFPVLKWQAGAAQTDASGLIINYRHGSFETNWLRLVLDVSQQVRILKTETRVSGTNYKYIIHLQPSKKDDLKLDVKEQKPCEAPVEPVKKPVVPPQATTSLKDDARPAVKKMIVIDAGHGGVDPGAIATNGVFEKNITLGVARELRDMLEESGRYRVKMTRDSDVFVILQDRVKIARQAKGDLFVSLHADTISRPAVQGASVYSLSDKASDAEAARLAERENQVDALVGGVNLGVQDKDVADILLDLVVRDNMNQSKILADTVVHGLRSGDVQTLEGSHRFAGFAVLKAPDIPSILVEMGYLSNAVEADRLNTVEHRQRIARAILHAIDTYFDETSKKTEF